MQGKNKTGRPARTAVSGKKASLGLKVTPEIKNRLDQVALENGRTQSQEAEVRLERSFDREDLIADVLSVRYGPSFAGMLYLIGEAMSGAGAVSTDLEGEAAEGWIDDPYAFEQAVKAAKLVIESLRPDGKVEIPTSLNFKTGSGPLMGEVIGETHASTVLKGVATGKPDRFVPPPHRETERIARARRLLGEPLILRIAKWDERRKNKASP